MRILHWYPKFYRGGAVANAVLGLAQAQSCLGAVVSIAAIRTSERPLYEAMVGGDGVTILDWAPHPLQRRWRLHTVPREARARLRALSPDVVHVHGELNPDNLWVPALFDAPIVLSPHGGFHPVVFTQSAKTAKSLYLRVAKPVLYARVCAFHALSPAERNQIVGLLPDATVYCVPQGPNVRVQRSALPLVSEIRARVGFVFVGRLDVWTKGLDLLLEAFARVVQRLAGWDLTLTLAGPDWKGNMAALRRRAAEIGIESRLVLPGALTSEEVAALLSRSDIFIHLARRDALALSVLEALVAGKPAIISTAVGTASYPEIASLPHVRVVALTVGAAAEAMIDFAERLDELRSLATRHQGPILEFFSWERAARMHLAMYGRLGAKRPQVNVGRRPEHRQAGTEVPL